MRLKYGFNLTDNHRSTFCYHMAHIIWVYKITDTIWKHESPSDSISFGLFNIFTNSSQSAFWVYWSSLRKFRVQILQLSMSRSKMTIVLNLTFSWNGFEILAMILKLRFGTLSTTMGIFLSISVCDCYMICSNLHFVGTIFRFCKLIIVFFIVIIIT